MMHGMFKANGGCGYVKKPDFMMNKGPDGEVFDPKAKLPIKTTLKVKVYMGKGWDSCFQRTCFNTWSSPNFYTRVNSFAHFEKTYIYAKDLKLFDLDVYFGTLALFCLCFMWIALLCETRWG